MLEPPTTAIMPLPDRLFKLPTTPTRLNVGFPAAPLALATSIPLLVVAIERFTTVPPVLTTIPVASDSKAPDTPFKTIWRVDNAPPSTSPTPVEPDNALEFGKVGCWFRVKKVWFCAGEAAIAAVVVCTVWPF